MREVRLATKSYFIKNDKKAESILMLTSKVPTDEYYEGKVFLNLFYSQITHATLANCDDPVPSLEKMEEMFFEYIKDHSEKELIDAMFVHACELQYLDGGLSPDKEALKASCKKLDTYDEY